MKFEDDLTREDYIKLQGLRKIHDNLEQRQEDIRESAKSIFHEITSFEEDEDIEFKLQGLGTDSMMSMKSLDKYLADKGIEVEEGDSEDE
jgi:hypothetical protein